MNKNRTGKNWDVVLILITIKNNILSWLSWLFLLFTRARENNACMYNDTFYFSYIKIGFVK